MYRCESWTIKKVECWRIDAFELWCWRTLLRVPWTVRRSSQSILKEMKWKSLSCVCLLRPHRRYSPWNSLGQNTGVGSLFLLQGIFPTQWSHPGLPHCRWILYQLSHKGSPRILEWVAYPFSGDLANPGIEPGSPALQADSLPTELPGKPTPAPKLYFPGSFQPTWK